MKQLAYLAGLVRFALKANPLLYFSVLVTLASAAIELLAMASLMPLLNLVSGSGKASGLIVRGLEMLGVIVTPEALLWTFLLLFMARIVSQVIGQTLFTFLGRRVMAQLGSTAFAQITANLSLAEISKKSIGYYIGLAGEEAFRASVVVISLAQFVGTAALSVLYFAAIAYFSPSAAGLLLVFLAVSGLFVLATTRVSARFGSRQATQSRAAASVFLDALNNLKVVRAFSAESYVAALYSRLIFGYSRTWFWIDELAVLSRMVPVIALLALCGTWLALSSGSLAQLGLPFIVTLIAFFIRFFPTLGQGVSLFMKVSAESRSGKDMSGIISMSANPVAELPELRDPVQTIELEAVSFRFAGEDSRPILANLDLRLVRGRSYALAGRSGTGKSTLADLVVGFQSPGSGTVRINGQDTSQLSARQLRSKILLVSQESAIFNETLANNLQLGASATVEAMRKACEAMELGELLEQMPEGLDTVIQYHGRNLSGGQRQRIALARALLREPDVLILDESTSALDKHTQEKIVSRLIEHFADRIIVFVTHDPSILAMVDEVIELPDLGQARAAAGADA